MAKGAGFEVGDMALIATLFGVGYLAYKTIGEPIARVGNSVGTVTDAIAKPIDALSEEASDIIESSGNLIEGIIETPQAYWNYWFTLGEDAGETVKGWFN